MAYINFSIGCGCNSVGVSNSECADNTGTCTCSSGFTGDKCDMCDTNYYGVATTSCTACTCSTRGTSLCDSITGACTCNVGYTGVTCDSCDTGYYDDTTSNACERKNLLT